MNPARRTSQVSCERTQDMMHMINDGPSQVFDPVDSDEQHQLLHPRQQVVLYNLSTAGVPPLAADPARPRLRILGLFAARELAIEHARSYAAEDPSCTMLLAPAHEWRALARTVPWEGEASHVRQLQQQHRERTARTRAEFEAHKRESAPEAAPGTPAPTLEPATARPREAAAEPADAGPSRASDAAAPVAQKINVSGLFVRSHAITLQQFAAVCVILDDASAPQPIFRVLQAFASETDADAYVRNCACHSIREEDILIAPMYEWIDVNAPPTKVELRDQALNKIMADKRRSNAQLQTYKATGELPAVDA